MQLHKDIPTLGGLSKDPAPSRRATLQEEGARAQQQIAGLLRRARARAISLALFRGGAVFLAGAQVALLLGALLAAVNGAWLARSLAIGLGLLSAAVTFVFWQRSLLQRAAA